MSLHLEFIEVNISGYKHLVSTIRKLLVLPPNSIVVVVVVVIFNAGVVL